MRPSRKTLWTAAITAAILLPPSLYVGHKLDPPIEFPESYTVWGTGADGLPLARVAYDTTDPRACRFLANYFLEKSGTYADVAVGSRRIMVKEGVEPACQGAGTVSAFVRRPPAEADI